MDEPARAALIAVWEADLKRFEEHENKAGIGRAKDAIAKIKSSPLGHAPGSRRPSTFMSQESRLGVAHAGARPEPRSSPKVVTDDTAPAGEASAEDAPRVRVKRPASTP
jgi:hypothetical protein